ncbi:M23 family metallopeptidase [Planotetraspora thailandica]|nr:M23 family metallopeptidase [Planotetraspora thailandica]
MRAAKLAVIAGAGCLAVACSGPGSATSAGKPAPETSATVSGTPAAKPPRPAKPAGGRPVRMLPPRVSPYDYVFPIKGCRTTYAHKLLAGLPKSTIWAGKGCLFVSPVDGRIREVNRQDRWRPATDRGPDREGRFLTIAGQDGVVYLGGHLDKIMPGLKPGVSVKAGQPLGSVGNSGNARNTASNLYFAISWPAPPKYWWIRRGMVEPWTFLDAWYDGNRTLSPKPATLAVLQRAGKLPKCTVLCVPKPVDKSADTPGTTA